MSAFTNSTASARFLDRNSGRPVRAVVCSASGPEAPRVAAVVIGAGPAGALAALHLQRGGFSSVTVLEQRLPTQTVSTGVNQSRKSYSIILSDRGMKSLKCFPGLLDNVSDRGIKCCNSTSYRRTGQTVAKQRTRPASWSVDRQDIVDAIVKYAGDKVDWKFGMRVDSVDFDNRVVACTNISNAKLTYPYDLLVVAQGVYSSVRQAAAERGLLEVHKQKSDQMQWKIASLGLPSSWRIPPPPSKPGTGDFFIFSAHQPLITLLAPPRKDGHVNAIVVVEKGDFDKGALLGDREAVKREFAKRFPAVFGEGNMPTDAFADDILAQPVSIGGVTTILSRYDVMDSVVFVGDCASSCWPSLGQGCNQALESVDVLAQHLFRGATDSRCMPTASELGERLQAFTVARRPDADAVGEMSENGFGKNARAPTFWTFARIGVTLLAHKVFGTAQPAIFSLSTPDVPYREVWQQWQRQNRTVENVVWAMTGCAVAVALAGVRLAVMTR